jgi:hypothetical protein
MNENEENKQGITQQNMQFINNDSFMHLRINTETVLQRVETFLTGERVLWIEANTPTGVAQEKIVIGKPLANKQGINDIMNSLYLMINQHTVQGNLKEDMYWEAVAQCREEITLDFLENGNEWGVQDFKYRYIVDKIMFFLEQFLSRLINNKERDSYAASMVSKEIISPEFLKKKGALALFGSGRGANVGY